MGSQSRRKVLLALRRGRGSSLDVGVWTLGPRASEVVEVADESFGSGVPTPNRTVRHGSLFDRSEDENLSGRPGEVLGTDRREVVGIFLHVRTQVNRGEEVGRRDPTG